MPARDKPGPGDEGPSLLPSDDAPFGPPASEDKPKRRMFGGKSRDAGVESRAGGVESRAGGDDDDGPLSEPAPLEDAAADPWAEDAAVRPPVRPAATPWAERSAESDPFEHELEFVFAGGESGGSRVKVAREKKEKVRAVGGRSDRGPSTGAIIAIIILALLVAAVVAYALVLSDDDEEPLPTLPPVPTVSAAPTAAPTAAPVALPEECVNSFLYAQAHPDDRPNVERTAELCPTVDQWLTAARQYPAAIGAADASEVGDDDVVAMCEAVEASAMCQDAKAKGIIGGEAPGPATASPGPVATGSA